MKPLWLFLGKGFKIALKEKFYFLIITIIPYGTKYLKYLSAFSECSIGGITFALNLPYGVCSTKTLKNTDTNLAQCISSQRVYRFTIYIVLCTLLL